ncbi:phenazine biosynthesis protein [Halobacteriales archaeon QS_3_64_16]|nr:MAG: phenazine biosynthesis protein [Halobacteriales archaeon QS_3_64_16]
MSHPFHIVDVFAQQRYTGNQLAVVRAAGDLSDREMQQIAAEMSYSETTFIESEEQSAEGYPVRIFTPETELPFAGHPTLGTACVLRETVLGDDSEVEGVIPLSLGVGEVPVTIERGEERDSGEDERFWMRQPDPSFDEQVDPGLAAGVLGLDEGNLDADFLPCVVSTGLPTLVVPLRSTEAVREARIDDANYGVLLDATDAGLVLAVCSGTVQPENDLHVRVFAEAHGVSEDPATGSANGCLAAYLARERYFDSSTIEARVEQGYELDRPSLLLLRANDRVGRAGRTGNSATEKRAGRKDGDEAGSGVEVRVGGRVIPVAEGELL